jgi:hypothetical protein
MSYPQQPGNWSDPSWPSGQPGQPGQPGPPSQPPSQPYGDPSQPYGDPSQPYGDPSQSSGVPASPAAGYPTSPTSGYPGYPPQAYPAPGYPSAYPNYGYNTPQTTQSANGLAIASLICSIAGVVTCGVTSLVGAILGHIARRQIAQQQQSGAGLALAGIITGWVVTGLWAVFWTLFVIGIVAAENGTTTNNFDDALRLLSLRAG